MASVCEAISADQHGRVLPYHIGRIPANVRTLTVEQLPGHKVADIEVLLRDSTMLEYQMNVLLYYAVSLVP
jgi:hypothetical protein